MAQGYYTLEEAAQLLGLSVDELKQIARKGEVRSFQDRGTWRFRVQDIQEMARRRGLGSDADVPLSAPLVPTQPASGGPKSMGPKSPGPRSQGPKSPPPKSMGPKSSGPKSSGPKSPPKSPAADVFDFSLDIDEDHTGIGREDLGIGPGTSRAGQSSSKKNKPLTPTPTPGSDSDVRLVSDDNDFVFKLNIDSDVKLADMPQSGPKSSGKVGPQSKAKVGGGPASGSPSSKINPRSKTGTGAPERVDSGVRLSPMDSDSDVKIVPAESAEIPLSGQPPRSATDSDPRLDKASSAGHEGMITEEINLDEEQQKQGPQSKARQAPQPQLPTSSPFELTESELHLPETESQVRSRPSSSELETTPAGESSSPLEPSSEFELTPAGQSSSPLDQASDEFNLELPEDSVNLGDMPSKTNLKSPASGISLDNPLDSGISLEQGGDEIQFSLNLDDEGPRSKPVPAAPEAETSSEFELTLDTDESAHPETSSEFELSLEPTDGSSADDSAADSEFELTLDSDEDPQAGADAESSDSEFELTLDESGNVGTEDEGPQAKADEQDIFETDFEVPALDDSGSEAVALDEGDTDLESSDFDLALDESDVQAEEGESGSQVVTLDDEENVDDAAATVAAKAGRGQQAAGLEEEPGFGELGEEDAGEPAGEEEAERAAEEPIYQDKEVVAAPWGVLPVVVMLPCVVVMLLVGIMGFELIQSMTGYKQPGMLTKAISGLVGQNIKN